MSARQSGSGLEEPPGQADAPCMVATADRLLSQKPILLGDYCRRLADGRMTRTEFIATQQQFFFAVRFFSRPIAALVSRCPDSAMRMDLVHNLAEEQGSFRPGEAHDRTFLQFLHSLGVTREEQARVREGPEVQAFNCALLGACSGAEVEVAFGCLGIIEHAFADISALIGRVVIERGWVAPGDLVHYKLHAQIDKRHAEEFFAVIERAWSESPVKRRLIEQGLALGHHLFERLYSDLASRAAHDELRE